MQILVAAQVHQELSSLDIARARSIANLPIVSENPDTYGQEVAYWADENNPGKQVNRSACPVGDSMAATARASTYLRFVVEQATIMCFSGGRYSSRWQEKI